MKGLIMLLALILIKVNVICAQINNQENDTMFILELVDTLPQFPGDYKDYRKHFYNNINFDILSKNSSVVIKYIISNKGELIDFDILGCTDTIFSNEVLRALKLSPKFKPAKVKNKEVYTYQTLSLSWKFNKNFNKNYLQFHSPRYLVEEDKDEIFLFLKNKPKIKNYANVNEYINKNLIYPKKAKRKKNEGIVSFEILILANGKIGNIKLLKESYPLLNNEAYRLIQNMPDFTPATNGIHEEHYVMKVNVEFRLK